MSTRLRTVSGVEYGEPYCMAWYSLFVLKMPLNANQPTNIVFWVCFDTCSWQRYECSWFSWRMRWTTAFRSRISSRQPAWSCASRSWRSVVRLWSTTLSLRPLKLEPRRSVVFPSFLPLLSRLPSGLWDHWSGWFIPMPLSRLTQALCTDSDDIIWIDGFNDKKELIFLLDDRDPDLIPEVTVINIEAITAGVVGSVGGSLYNYISGSLYIYYIYCSLGYRKGIRPVKSWVLVCWWWFDCSFSRLIALVVTTISIILSTNKIQMG